MLAVLSAGYMLPFAVATTRRRRNAPAIFFLNALFGWTIIGWVLALVMALSNKAEPASLQNAVDEAAAEIPPPAPTPTQNRGLTTELRELADLHASGSLSDEEFATAKARLLG